MGIPIFIILYMQQILLNHLRDLSVSRRNSSKRFFWREYTLNRTSNCKSCFVLNRLNILTKSSVIRLVVQNISIVKCGLLTGLLMIINIYSRLTSFEALLWEVSIVKRKILLCKYLFVYDRCVNFVGNSCYKNKLILQLKRYFLPL